MNRLQLPSIAAAAAVLALAPAMGCSKTGSPAAPSSAVVAGGTQDKGGPATTTQPVRLNLSHIDCVEDGTVEVHFVLLNVPNNVEPPATLDFTFDGGGGTANRRDPKTGNVWHYSAFLASPVTIENLNASIEVGGQTISLHNPGAYSGTYICGTNDVCDLAPEPVDLVCLASPLGNPLSECSYFFPGSTPLGKDNTVTSVPHEATMNAALAIVKTGSGQTGCAPGEHAYRTYANVNIGDLLASPGTGTGISHVTYCSCPAPTE